MATGAINAGLPGIKQLAVDVLSVDYATKEEALHSIEEALTGHYQKKFGEAYDQHKKSVEDSLGQIMVIYQNNFFPEMRTRWDSHPDNIGHLITPGCFRCHGGEHTSDKGAIIPRDCATCHSIIEQGPPGNLEKSTEGLPFRHPVDIGEAWKELNCYECHATE
jgi:hypothetical protein